MIQTPLSNQAKALMDAAEALEKSVVLKYGINSKAANSAFHCVGHQFYLYCELEQAEVDEVDKT